MRPPAYTHWMRVIFLDDSVRTGRREGMGKVVAIGGIIVDEDQLRPLSEAVDAIATRYKVPSGCELKWFPPRDNWIRNNLVDKPRHDCYAEILDAAHTHGAKALVVAIDTGRASQKGSAALLKAFEYAIERVQMRLENDGTLGLVVADRPGGGAGEDTRFLHEVLTMVEDGTVFVQAKQIVFNVVTTPSHLVRHLQIADLVVGITAALVAGDETYAAPIYPHVKQLLLRNSYGYIPGTGIKLWPNSLLNLHHWAFGDDTYMRAAWNSGHILPWWELPYFFDGFDARRQDPAERAAYIASLPPPSTPGGSARP